MSGVRQRAGARRRRTRWRRIADLLLAAAVLGALGLAAARTPSPQPAETLRGPVRVADGDSLVMNGTRIRLRGIDAPELAQRCRGRSGDYECGREAQAALERLVAGRTVACRSSGTDRYGRALARCMAGTTELNGAMVEAGWAVAYGDYREQEAAARQAGRGLWAGSFEQPAQWRRIHGGLAEMPHGGVAALWDWLRRLWGV